MKLLWCDKCNDLFRLLRVETRTCFCGRVWGAYNADGDTAWYNGKGTLLAIGNSQLLRLVNEGIIAEIVVYPKNEKITVRL